MHGAWQGQGAGSSGETKAGEAASGPGRLASDAERSQGLLLVPEPSLTSSPSIVAGPPTCPRVSAGL